MGSAASVPDVPWLGQRGDGRWIFGRGDRGPVRRLPAGETGLAIDGSFVASVSAGPDGRSVVRIRDLPSGRPIRDAVAPIWVSAGAWTRAGLVVTGYRDRSMAEDGGLVLIDPESGATTSLVEPGPFSSRLGQPVARGDVQVSPSGATAASNSCGVRLCDLQVVDLMTGRVTRPLEAAEGFLRATTDEVVITTDDSYDWISARSIADGVERWRVPDVALIDPMAIDDGAIVGLVGSDRAGWSIALIDAAGRSRDLTPRTRAGQTVPRIWRSLSTGAVVVIARPPFEEALEGRSMSVSIVSPRDGHAVQAAVQIPAASEAVP